MPIGIIPAIDGVINNCHLLLETDAACVEKGHALCAELCEAAGINTPSMTVLFNLASLYAIDGGVRAFVFVLMVFFAVSLAHSRPFDKLGKMGKVLYFFGVFFIVQTFAGIVTKLIKIYLVISESAFTFTISEREVQAAWSLGYGAFPITNVYVVAVLSVVLFLATAYIIDRKVNVD